MIRILSGFFASLGALGILAFWVLFITMFVGYCMNVYGFVTALMYPSTVPTYEWILRVIGFFHLYIGGLVGIFL